ncbi:MAG TPA: alpha/beta fold hydrolase [Anaerolineales bacterium]|nr:alpha/beta fold hydrolase [Anaerolineales bacterium]
MNTQSALPSHWNLTKRKYWQVISLGLLLLGLVGCQAPGVPASPTSPVTPVLPSSTPPAALPTPVAHNVSTAAEIPSSPTSAPSPTPTSTPDPYAPWTIDYLREREYGGGEIEVQETLQVTSYYTRYLISYPSDGLQIYGFANIPTGEGPFPVIIALHGYIEPPLYQTLDYTTGYADTLARAGFLVLHPNLRGYRPSDEGENLFRVGMATDVLNLIALVQTQAGQPGILEQADGEAIGLWGHSMGGGISTRVITVSPAVKAAVLYAAMSGDERQNYEAINSWSYSIRGVEELAVPEEELTRISPIYFLENITAAVSIHHGESDELVPLGWSQDLCERLTLLEKRVECFTYPKMPHTFNGEGEQLFNQRVIEFFTRELQQ